VVDGNVYRVLARFFGIATPTNTPAAKREFTLLANQLLDPSRPAVFNQAIMDFGATGCKPRQPRCSECPLASRCVALSKGQVADLPIKSKKIERKERFFLYLVPRWQGDTWVRKRTAKDIWQNLFEFLMLETEALPTDASEAMRLFFEHADIPVEWLREGRLSVPHRQTLTHREVAAVFFEVHLPRDPTPLLSRPFWSDGQRVGWSDLKKKFAFPRVVDRYLHESAVVLTLF
jgi:A/G-specific adenine glycosylase